MYGVLGHLKFEYSFGDQSFEFVSKLEEDIISLPNTNISFTVKNIAYVIDTIYYVVLIDKNNNEYVVEDELKFSIDNINGKILLKTL